MFTTSAWIRLTSKVVRPLKGLRVAPYLGCMVPRPDYEHRWSDHEHPVELDLLLEALGAEVIDFPLKTHCCGGHMTQIGPDTAFELIRRLVSSADDYEADIMATLCPMCQMNLDAYQNETNQHFGTNYQDADCVLHPVDGAGFRVGAQRARLRHGTGQRDEALGKDRPGSAGTCRRQRRRAHARQTDCPCRHRFPSKRTQTAEKDEVAK